MNFDDLLKKLNFDGTIDKEKYNAVRYQLTKTHGKLKTHYNAKIKIKGTVITILPVVEKYRYGIHVSFLFLMKPVFVNDIEFQNMWCDGTSEFSNIKEGDNVEFECSRGSMYKYNDMLYKLGRFAKVSSVFISSKIENLETNKSLLQVNDLLKMLNFDRSINKITYDSIKDNIQYDTKIEIKGVVNRKFNNKFILSPVFINNIEFDHLWCSCHKNIFRKIKKQDIVEFTCVQWSMYNHSDNEYKLGSSNKIYDFIIKSKKTDVFLGDIVKIDNSKMIEDLYTLSWNNYEPKRNLNKLYFIFFLYFIIIYLLYVFN